MLTTLLLSLFSFTLMYFAFVRSRYRYAHDRDARLAVSDANA
jgi:hypothetical protein